MYSQCFSVLQNESNKMNFKTYLKAFNYLALQFYTIYVIVTYQVLHSAQGQTIPTHTRFDPDRNVKPPPPTFFCMFLHSNLNNLRPWGFGFGFWTSQTRKIGLFFRKIPNSNRNNFFCVNR
jgi:hypothetical protein